MSYASPIVLKNAAAANENFVRLNADANKVNYMLATSTLQAPVFLVVGHQLTTAQDGSDRHLVKIARTVVGTDLKPRTCVISCTIAVPRNTISRVDVDNGIAELKEFLTTANVDALLRGEL